MRWFFPSYRGDFRLEADGPCSVLRVTAPTDHERAVLGRFLAKARAKGWTDVQEAREGDTHLAAPVADSGKLLLRFCKPKRKTLTAVRFEDGRIAVEEGAAAHAVVPEAQSAASLARPTLCCPRCVTGPLDAATEVLFAFCDDAERGDWQRHHAIICEGGVTGHRYLLAHRHSPVARRMGFICRDLDDGITLHFHDPFVPPPEEVLAAKLMLEHREAWLRNDATMWGLPERFMRLENPFGDHRDGTGTAGVLRMVGGAVGGWQMGATMGMQA